MGNTGLRRRRPAFAAGLATLALALGVTAAPAEASAPDVDYVALGDSYTAGTGAGPFVPTSNCVQTANGYVDVVDADPAVNLAAKAACHGAFIDDTSNGVPTLRQQITAVAGGALSRDTELVTLTAGANDVGVNTTLFVCATSTTDACKQAVAASIKAMPSMGVKLTRAIADIRRVAPNAKIVVLGYPKLFNPAGLPTQVSPTNQTLVNGGTSLLNATLAASVSSARIFYRANAQYVDVTERFRGHAVNDPASWIFFDVVRDLNGNPVIDGNGNPIPDPRNFHPNAAGHSSGYAPAVTSSVPLAQLARP